MRLADRRPGRYDSKPPSKSCMLDIKRIRENPDEARRRLATRGKGDEQSVDALLALDQKRRELLVQVEQLKAERNRASKEIGAKKSKNESADALMAEMKAVSDKIAVLDSKVADVELQQEGLLLRIPNLPHADVPVGLDEAANRTERVWGQPPVYAFTPKPHWEIGAALDILDLPRAAKISGSGFIVFKGLGAKLERTLINLLLDLHIEEHGYLEIAPPFAVRESSMIGTGQLPKFAEDMYRIAEEDLWLVPTAEVPVTNLHREEILEAAALPIQYVAYTPCFRREAGSAGKDTRGIIRVHQFDKVELVHIVHPDVSYETLERLVGHAEKVLQLLGLHYRVVSLSTGDLGFGAARCYDLEVWAPGLGKWLEVSSCSNFEDFQARRMGLRFKNGAKGENRFCHTLNGSGTALARLVIALLETYQQADGSVLLPAALHPTFGSDRIGPA